MIARPDPNFPANFRVTTERTPDHMVVNRPVIERALRSAITDFEDAVIEESGRVAGAECIVSRNTKDFRRASLKVFDPIEFLLQLGK